MTFGLKNWLFILALSPFMTMAQNVDKPIDTTEPTSDFDVFDIMLSEAEIDESGATVGSISGILSSSQDMYHNTASYQFGNTRYRVKGFTSNQEQVTINGIPMNDPSSGRTSFALWGGLNDVTRYPSVVPGIGFSEYAYGDVGGHVNYSMMASEKQKGFRATYSAGNRAYRHRAMITYNSGLLPSGWAFSVSGSRRYAEEGYVDGCGYDAWAYFLGIEKRIGEQHTLNFAGFGAPRTNGRTSASTQEAYDLAGSNYYNPNWGYQNGKKRNASIAKSHQPQFILTHKWKISDKSDLTTSAAYGFGRYGTTSISWVSGNDPRPDYYKNLPSYYLYTRLNLDKYEEEKLDWETNVNRRQIDWDKFYTANRNRVDQIFDENGTMIAAGFRANYYVQERRSDKRQFNLSSVYNYSYDNLSWNVGINAAIFKGYNFMTIVDLLGADYYLDIDKYVMRDSIAEAGQRIPMAANSNLNNPNHICHVGDKCGYYYIANTNNAELFGQVVYSFPKLELMGGAKIKYVNFWRTGKWRNGIHTDNSYGDSKKQNFVNFSIKAGATYKLNGRNYVILNALCQTDAPSFQNSFETVRTNNAVVADLKSRKVIATDLSYNIKLPTLKARASVYYSQNLDDMSVRNVYIEGRDEQTSNGGVYGSYIWRNLDRIHYGVELGLEWDITASLRYQMAGGMGRFGYSSRPTIQIISDNGMTNQTDIAYMKNYRIGGFPQSAMSAGLRYSINYWNIGATLCYYTDIYTEIFPERLTEYATAGYTPEHENYRKIHHQDKLDDGFILDCYISKSWRIASNYYLAFSASLNNVFNNTDFAYSGYQQYRLDKKNPDRFQNKLLYAWGRELFVNMSFRF